LNLPARKVEIGPSFKASSFALLADDEPSRAKLGRHPHSVVKIRRRIFVEEDDEPFILILSKDLGCYPDALSGSDTPIMVNLYAHGMLLLHR
jgi:hypothetical protein